MFKAFATGPDLPLRTDAGVDADYRRYRMAVIVAITLGYGISYTCRLAINVVKKPLIDGGIFTPDDLGVIGSALFYSYAAGKLINGFVSDHANARTLFRDRAAGIGALQCRDGVFDRALGRRRWSGA